MFLQIGCHRLAMMHHQRWLTTRRPLAAMCTQMCWPLAAMCTLGCPTCGRMIKQRMTAICRGCCQNGAHTQITTSACVKQNWPHFGFLPVCQTTGGRNF